MLMERARSMLSGAGLGQEFWAEVVETACYLVNRSPSLAMWSSRGKNITQPNILPLVVFFPQGATREISHLSNPAMPIVSLHQENFSELTDFVNASVVFFKVST